MCREYYDARDTVVGPSDGPPTMMSFKAFLAAQDDSITVDDAIQKYNEYKLEFRRQQLNEFFVAHKDEEWYVFIRGQYQCMLHQFIFEFLNKIETDHETYLLRIYLSLTN